MECGRYSKEYAKFLYDRFHRRYKETCSVRVYCDETVCDQFKTVKATEPEKKFKCDSCSSSTEKTE